MYCIVLYCIVLYSQYYFDLVGNGASKFFQGAGQGVGHVFGGGKCFFLLAPYATCQFHSHVLLHKISYINSLDLALFVSIC